MLAWSESLPVHLVYLCLPTKCGPVTFLASLGGPYTAASFIPRREFQIQLTVEAVMESQPFLKLQSLVVLGGKWLPFSLVGGIPTFVKEPHWWHKNGFPCSMIRRWPHQIKWFILFFARAFAPIKNDHIWSFNSQPLISC